MTKLLTLLDRLHWLWLILAAPLMLFPNPKRSLAMLIVPGLWLLHCIVTRISPAPLPITPLNSTILLMAVMVLVSTWATYDIAFSLPKISGMILGLGVFFAAAREARRPRGWWLSLILFLVMGVGVAGLGLLGTDWFTSKISLLNPVTSRLPALITGLQGAETGFHPNEIAGALTWVLPVLLVFSIYSIKLLPDSPSPTGRGGWGVRERGVRERGGWGVREREVWGERADRWKIWIACLLLWLATLFVTSVFILTQSRGGYLALALTSLVLLFIALPRRWRWALLGLLMITGLIIGLVLSKEDLITARDWLTGSGITTDNALSLNTLEGRVEIWSRAIYGLQDFPFTGMGMNTFREVVHVLYPLFLIAPDIDIGHAHNEFLQVGLDLGIPGLIAFLALYIGAFWMLVDVSKRTQNSNRFHRVIASSECISRGTAISSNNPYILTLGLAGGLAAHLLYGLTDTVALGAKPGVLFWMLLGLVAGLHAQVNTSAG
ncbi:MAG: O-antigen ligase family protein [Chloroflexota bacterium]|nr:O-antigen ligase family protein [Chloroflexota bacterium]